MQSVNINELKQLQTQVSAILMANWRYSKAEMAAAIHTTIKGVKVVAIDNQNTITVVTDRGTVQHRRVVEPIEA
ncbi:hypothetical protein AVT69_gp362 [Pseudomonas phage PhiPA3]|uniref:Uncharacterized protein 374 n=1 Tax=Pseudomonas phage PhiPA3 TaxID=998086 RepID=F8SJK6_BPPA3|nr:hypothetical protein AVT69_gp362 [Pseudomonas phage PhiPA3]AEH03797.1 hypothetical protein [Pseudomonas phage PhiPA3]